MSISNYTHVVVHEYPPPHDGGIAQIAFNLAEGLSKQGFKSILCGFAHYLNHPLYKNVGFQLFPIIEKGWKHFKDIYLILLALQLFCKYGHSVILYSLTWKTSRSISWLNRFLKWKLIVYVQGLEFTRQLGTHKEHQMLRTINRAHLIATISSYMVNQLKKASVKPPVVLDWPGVNCHDFSPSNRASAKSSFNWENHKIILTIGRLVPRKGQDTVIKVLPEILKKIPDARYIIAGTGAPEERERLTLLAKECNVSDAVIFFGFVDESHKAQLYNACDLYIMNSRLIDEKKDVEGFGITFLEANACGRAVIGGNSGGVPDAIAHGESGFLVKPDSLQELTDTILRYLSDDVLRSRIETTARKRVETLFTWQAHTQRLIDGIHTHRILDIGDRPQ